MLYAKDDSKKNIETECSGRFTAKYKLPCKHMLNVDDKSYSIPSDSIGRRCLLDERDSTANEQSNESDEVSSSQSSAAHFAQVTEKLTDVLYKLEAVIASEQVQSNQLQYILQLESLYNDITAENSEEHLMLPSQSSQQKSKKSNHR